LQGILTLGPPLWEGQVSKRDHDTPIFPFFPLGWGGRVPFSRAIVPFPSLCVRGPLHWSPRLPLLAPYHLEKRKVSFHGLKKPQKHKDTPHIEYSKRKLYISLKHKIILAPQPITLSKQTSKNDSPLSNHLIKKLDSPQP